MECSRSLVTDLMAGIGKNHLIKISFSEAEVKYGG